MLDVSSLRLFIFLAGLRESGESGDSGELSKVDSFDNNLFIPSLLDFCLAVQMIKYGIHAFDYFVSSKLNYAFQ